MKKILVIVGLIILVLFLVGCDEDETEKYNLSISKEGEGKIYFEGEESKYEAEEEVIINAKAVIGYQFDRWGGDIDSTDSETRIIMDEEKDITAYFVKEGLDEMVLVEAGTTSENNGSITVDNDFYIDKYHVTQEEFEEVMGFNPSGFNDEDHPDLTRDNADRPVEHVTWYDAVKYANQLSKEEGLDKYYNISDIEYGGEYAGDNNIGYAEVTENEEANGYRLATEEEHEYAARGGKNGDATTYAGSDNLDDVGWYKYNSDVANSEYEDWGYDGHGTMPVGEKEANELGLYDMSGNVYDWTNTPDGSRRVRRGGSWHTNARNCGVSSSRSHTPSNTRRFRPFLGFRLARYP